MTDENFKPPQPATAEQAGIYEVTREAKIGLINLFTQMAVSGNMDVAEVNESIENMLQAGHITEKDAVSLRKNLENATSSTPEQIRAKKLGLLNKFIELVVAGQMDSQEVMEYVEKIKQAGHINEQDAQEVLNRLLTATGASPEQIHDKKVGLINFFIKMAQEGTMEPDEVIDAINIMKNAGHLTVEEVAELTQKLTEATAQPPEQ